MWLASGDALFGTEIVSFKAYRLAGPIAILKPCEISFRAGLGLVIGFDPLSEGPLVSVSMRN